MSDLVSIIMPSYNTGACIAKSIQSVQAQTYSNWELIIIDDDSNDDTDAIVSGFLDNRIIYLKNEKNKGAAFSRNRALREAKGRWIAFLDSDDVWFPEKLEKQIAFMEKNAYAFSYTNYMEMDAEGNETDTIITGPRHISRRGMECYCWPGCLTVMYDANVVGKIQITDIKKNNDYAMWLQVSKKTECYLLEEVLAVYRRGRSGSISSYNYVELIKWHYKLFHEAEGKGVWKSLVATCVNIIFGIYKKLVYVRKGR